MSARVIDRQAHIDAPTFEETVSIDGKPYSRRMVDAARLITIMRECERSIARNKRDAWETEGDLSTAIREWTGVFIWSGDRKCSSSTFWNTGNPRALCESHAWIDFANASKPVGPDLHEWLARSFQRASYTDIGQPLSSWYAGDAGEIRSAVADYLARFTIPDSPRRQRRPIAGPSLVYQMGEEGTEWVKIGKCGPSTSPPANRRSMYQGGNPREIIPLAAWTFEGTNPERRSKLALTEEAKRRGRSYRSEWFDVGAEEALVVLRDLLSDCSEVSSAMLGRG